LFDLAKTLAWQPATNGGVGIVTNGGGLGVLAADAADRLDLILPEITVETKEIIGRSSEMPATVNLANPLDIIGDAGTDRYRLAMESLLGQEDINILVVIQTKQTMTDIRSNMEAIIEAKNRYPQKAVVSVCLPGKFSWPAIKWLESKKVPNYSDPSRALKAVWALNKYA